MTAHGSTMAAAGEVAIDALVVRHDRNHVIGPVTIDAPPGTWLALAGPNGSGKTTILRAIAGLSRYDGVITLAGQSMQTLSRRALARAVALVPQLPTVPEDMSVADYVLLGRTAFVSLLGTESDEDRAAVEDVLERLDLAPFASRRLGTISGGELQRAVLARALVQQAPILLLDEPTAALDLGHVQQVLELVDALRNEHALTVIAAMHDLTLAAQFADRVVLLDGGRVARAGTPVDVFDAGTIARIYGANVDVTMHGGRPAITPIRARDGGRA